jgi:predicted class III extradiol MEMO1 family dioxygenase
LCGLALVVLGYFFPFFSSSTSHFAIIPHFMLASKKVDQFYAFLKNQRYANRDPDTIIIISPNHYHQHSSSPQTICETSDVYFKDVSYQLTPFPGVACDGEIFFPFGKSLITREHGIGEHLARIVTYFPEVEQIIPLILPTHLFPFISEEATLGGF